MLQSEWRSTEKESKYSNLESRTTEELLNFINQEDQSVPLSVASSIPQITLLVNAVYEKMKSGGRLFYIGAGTSGRLGIVDASECPPTFGVPHGLVIGIIAGGDGAIRKAVEFAEDNSEQGFKDLMQYQVSSNDFVVGITASGTTPYVLGALKDCKSKGISTGSISCNFNTPLSGIADFPVEVVTGPEFLTGSTRLKAGTAQKLVLNMITTSVMIKLGRVKGNRMVDMMPTNNKLIHRGVRMIQDDFKVSETEAERLLLELGSVRNVLSHLQSREKGQE